MRVGVVFSGDAPSFHALYWVVRNGWEPHLLGINSGVQGIGFHKGVDIRLMQARSLELPLSTLTLGSDKSIIIDELGVNLASQGLDGIVSPVISSEYVRGVVSRACEGINIESFFPLWGIKPLTLLEDLVRIGFEVVFSRLKGPESFIGRKLDDEFLKVIRGLSSNGRYGMRELFGDYETLVVDGPLFRRRINTIFNIEKEDNTWVMRVTHAHLI